MESIYDVVTARNNFVLKIIKKVSDCKIVSIDEGEVYGTAYRIEIGQADDGLPVVTEKDEFGNVYEKTLSLVDLVRLVVSPNRYDLFSSLDCISSADQKNSLRGHWTQVVDLANGKSLTVYESERNGPSGDVDDYEHHIIGVEFGNVMVKRDEFHRHSYAYVHRYVCNIENIVELLVCADKAFEKVICCYKKHPRSSDPECERGESYSDCYFANIFSGYNC